MFWSKSQGGEVKSHDNVDRSESGIKSWLDGLTSGGNDDKSESSTEGVKGDGSEEGEKEGGEEEKPKEGFSLFGSMFGGKRKAKKSKRKTKKSKRKTRKSKTSKKSKKSKKSKRKSRKSRRK